ncbi:ribonuclease P protein component [Patescibacteria group bacterium]|nr:ribonuclease P protein component [Patescibacteria group bacterium]
MLTKPRRVRRQTEYDDIFKNGRAVHGSALTVRVAPGKGSTTFGFIVGTRVSASAVKRNQIKRRLRETIRTHLKEIVDGHTAAVIAKPPATTVSGPELSEELLRLLKRATILR